MDQRTSRGVLGILYCGLLSGLGSGCGSSADHSPTGMLPANNEVAGWVRVGTPTVISNDTDLYNQIDGGAPKYIDRGWVGSAYAEYSQDGISMQVAIHDMGSDANAQSLFSYELPASNQPIQGNSNSVLDTGLPAAYASESILGRFVIEVSIDARSDASLAAIEAFIIEILNRNAWAAQS